MFVQDQNKRRKEEKRRRRKPDESDGQTEKEKEVEDKNVFKKKCPICLDEYSVEARDEKCFASISDQIITWLMLLFGLLSSKIHFGRLGEN